ncbi:MAG: hypothetical protein GY795_44925 [Desulfobacterales bacterium]|nr:hypothetical protein [Desulfobacterales bacterium]
MKTASYNIILITVSAFLVTLTASGAFAELKLESVSETLGEIGEKLDVKLKGTGFDENTRVSMFLDVGNRSEIIGSVNLPKFAHGVTVAGNTAYVVGEKGLQIIDASDPQNPVWAGSLETPNAREVAVVGNTAYMVCSKGLKIIDVSNSSNPVEIATVNSLTDAEGITVAENTAYVADWTGLQIIDVGNTSEPIVKGSADLPPGANSVTVTGNTAYIAGGMNGLHIIDVSDPSNPQKLASFDTPGWAKQVAVIKDKAYVADKSGGLQIIDVSSPSAPEETGYFDTLTGLANGIAVAEDRAYVPHGSAGLEVIDVSSPSKPRALGYVDTPGLVNGIAMSGNTACVVSTTGYQYSTLYLIGAAHPTNHNVMGSTDGYAFEVAVKGNTAYVSYKDDDRIGLQILDVSDLFNPKEIAFLDTDRVEGIMATENKVYLAAGGLHIIDVSDPSNPQKIGYADTPGSAYDVAVIKGTAYVADSSEGLQIIDVSDSSNFGIIGSLDTPSDARGIAVTENTAYIATYGSGLRIIDVSDPLHPEELGAANISGCATRVAVADNIAYVAAACNNYILQIIDVSNPSNPQKKGYVNMKGYGKGVMVIDDTAYVAADADGLQLIDVSDPSHPTITGFVDTLGFADGISVNDGTAYVADFSKGVSIMPVPVEITPVTFMNEKELSLTITSPLIADHYTLRVFNETESDELAGSVSFVPPEESYLLDTKAIIVVGGLSGDNDEIEDGFANVADYAYNALLYQGYTAESIYYLSPYYSPPCDEEDSECMDSECMDSEGVDGYPTDDNLFCAINTWPAKAPSATELLIFFVGHGEEGAFKTNYPAINNKLEAKVLDKWLDDLQTNIAIPVILIYEACKSGSFISHLTPPDGEKRIVITSTSQEKDAYFNDKGNTSFSYQFWNFIRNGHKVIYTFKNIDMSQEPQIDINGDGIADVIDGETQSDDTDDIKIRRNYNPVMDIPYLNNLSADPPTLEEWEETSSKLKVSVSYTNDNTIIRRVWAIITPPDFGAEPTGMPITDFPTVEFEDTDNDGVYEEDYSSFTRGGEYKIKTYAMSEKGVYALPREIILKKERTYITDTSEDQILHGKTGTTVWASVIQDDNVKISRVWAEIEPPFLVEDFPIVEFYYREKEGVYEGIYNNFTAAGTYALTIYGDH